MMRKLLITLAAAVLPFTGSGSLQASETTVTADELQKQVEALKEQMNGLVQRIEALQSESERSAETTSDLEERTAYLEEDVEILDDRLMKPERHAALDKLQFQGDFRVEAHGIDSEIPDHVNGLGVQGDIVDTLFFFQSTGTLPPDFDTVDQTIRDNFADYQFFLRNLTFDELKQAVGQLQQMLPPDQFAGFMQQLGQRNFQRGYDFDNDVVYTSRLRLRLDAPVGDDVRFSGRLGMYKTWSNSTDAQVFNGQPTSIAWDGTTVGVPNSDILRVERAYFDWTDIGGLPVYASVGRRPSTGGAPLNFRDDELRGGTPLGSLVNYQFDGITLGWHIRDESTLRFCYGIGYESDWGNASELRQPADRLDDAAFYGFNWDVWDTDDMFVQATVARATNVTDGFNGLVVLPVDPLTGQDVPPAVIRFDPSVEVGDIDLASVVLIRHDGPVDWFLSANWMQSDPTANTGVFGGLFTDPFGTPEEQDGTMFYGGARYNFANGRTKLGLEFNHGSKYWFNFALAEDDFFAPKTSVRGDVWEVYLTHRVRDHFVFKLDYIDYAYDYSGSGWLLGEPKKLDDTPILGFPTYDDAGKWSVSFSARF